MELFRFGSIEETALGKLPPASRKLAVDRLRQYYALVFHPDITGSTNSPLAKINAHLDNLEKGNYKAPPANRSETSRLEERIHLLNEDIKYYKDCLRDQKIDFEVLREELLRVRLNKKQPNKIALSTLKCLRCGHEWIPRRNVKPKVCANCKSPYWNKPKWKQSGPRPSK